VRSATIALLLALLCGTARADDPPDVAATDAVLDRLAHELPRFGIGDLHIVGGGALALTRTARQGEPLAWNDIDVRGVASGPLDHATVERLAASLTRDGWATLEIPVPLEFKVQHPGPTRTTLRDQGYGLRMRHRSGLRFDVAVLRQPSDVVLSGYNNAESLMIPLREGDRVDTILTRLRRGSAHEVVAAGAVVEPHGQAVAVLSNRLALSNRYKATAEPELAALRFLRAKQKLSRGGTQVDSHESSRWLRRNLRGLVRRAPPVEDPSYLPQVQEQAAALLKTGDAHLLREARRMGLDLHKLARGEVARRGTLRRTARPLAGRRR
jgi:hypothetical protein